MPNESEKLVFEAGDLFFNGVNGETGEYGLPPMPSEKLSRFIQGEGTLEDLQKLVDEKKRARLEEMTEKEKQREDEEEEAHLGDLKWKVQLAGPLDAYPVKEGVDPTDLAQAGWAVVFPATRDAKRKKHFEEIKKALKPLLDLRREQAGGELFRIFEGGKGLWPGDRMATFFQRQEPEIRLGAADPVQMPFYVLLVGSPEEIPYKFQFQLDVMRGVGRIDFGADYEAYHRYAQSVVVAETGKVKLPRRATFFGIANPNDRATQLSARWLVNPLYENLQKPKIEGEITLKHSWQLDSLVGEGQATKAQLKRLLGGSTTKTPAFLFTASHGVEFDLGHPLQLKHQGALLCQDWDGPGHRVTPYDYFAGEDLDNANVLGMMAMFFACYGAGTPKLDHFAQRAFKTRAPIAPHGFIGALPRRMLSQGALAVIGHVERAWGYSFVSPGNHLDNQAFVTALRKLLNGEPVGLATDPSFDLRYADMSSQLSTLLEEAEFDPETVSAYELAHKWTATNDARNYVVVGDPAVRLPVGDVAPEEAERPVIEVSYRRPEPDTTTTEATYSAEEPTESEPEVVSPSPEAPTVAGPQAFTLSGTVTLQPTGAAPAAAFSGPEAALMAYGLRWPWSKPESEEEQEERKKLTETIKSIIDNAAEAATRLAREATTLQIVTYTSDDISKVDPTKIEKTAQPRAITRIKLDGDIKVCIPQKDGEIDKALWALHSEMVQQAQANRAEMLKMVVEAISGLVPR